MHSTSESGGSDVEGMGSALFPVVQVFSRSFKSGGGGSGGVVEGGVSEGAGPLPFLAGRPRPLRAGGFFAAAASRFCCLSNSRCAFFCCNANCRSAFFFSLSLFLCSFSSNSRSFLCCFSSSIFKQSPLVSTRALPVF